MLLSLREISMYAGVSRPSRLSIAIGRSPVCCSPLPGGPIRCLPLFIFVISSTNLTTFVPWVRLWLQVSGSTRSYLFPLIAGRGGEPSGPFFCMPCSSVSFSGACSGAYPTCSRKGSSISYCIIFIMYCDYILFLLSSSSLYCGFCRVSVFMRTSDVTRDGFLLHSFLSPLYRHCR